MQLTSLLVVSTTLLASQVPAQFIRSMIPNVPTWSASMASHSFQPMVHVHPPMHIAAQPSMRPVARPSSSSSFNTLNLNQGLRQPAAQHQDQTYAIPDGGLAPVDPLQPGSDVAPVLIQKPTGVDEGNSFCIGQCYASKKEAHCAKPYASPLYKSAHNCWMCCFTAGDF
ncbi:uncharacterized protein N7496_006157 [Penicillium cataractarum]|uniref:Uncharacterized protein n=1 Tax=Penicillium cataractarum TaxID=2100454 RepID=A0A9W9S2E0_9EURO|nr:uncharacterized protein N7496_006157 [Penicillium cataractarum]KAJ5370065.1 hypothetical protein N7496_006157 [Penicillium cataractarum]